ncbi:MAG: hypothetical protein L3J03_10475 [Desulfobacterales bacterium]|nr:hypothetical protein [Desulfobacterales bacterium]
MHPEQKQQHGFSLIAALFVIVILALFGTLISRLVAINSISSSEDYLSAQALYSAESAARLKIMCQDGGGTYGGGSTCRSYYPAIGELSTSGTYTVAATGYMSLRVIAGWNGAITREIEIKYKLQ